MELPVDTTRLEDVLPLWRIETRAALEKWLDDALADLGDSPAAVWGARLRQQTVQWATQQMAPHCLTWLAERGLCACAEDGRLRLEAAAAIEQRAAEFTPVLPEAQARIPYLSWAVPAAFGAAAGYMAGAGFNWLLGDQSAAMTFLGAIFGSGGMVGLIAWLSQRPTIRQALEVATGVAAVVASAGAIFEFFRRSPRGWLSSLPWLFGAWAVLWCARPQLKQPSPEDIRTMLRPQLHAYAAGVLDLLLAVVWASPRRVGQTVQEERPARIPEALLQALGILHVLMQEKDCPPSALLGPTRTVLARLRSAGYEWQELPSGARYTEMLEHQFECYGLTQEGEFVEMIEPALLHHGEVILRGKLRPVQS
jgi:hypothetical protein